MTSAGDTSALTPRQQRFVEEYPLDLNATQAYIRAGYSSRGATSSSVTLLSNPSVAAAINTALSERAARTGVSVDRVITELAAEAFVPAAALLAVGMTHRDKLRALELLGRHLGMFRPEVMIDNSVTVEGDVYWRRDPASDLSIIDQESAPEGAA